MYQTATKIVATIGPASWEPDMLQALMRAGVDVCRINCSHSDHAGIRRQVARIRRASMALNQPVGILLDLQGPKIRVGKVKEPIDLAVGDVLTVVMDDTLLGEGRRVGTTYPEMAEDVTVGVDVLFADGALMGRVVDVRRGEGPAEVDIEMTLGGELSSNKGINLPSVDMSVPSLTDKDRGDLEAGLAVGVDFVALSFVRSGADIDVLHTEMDRCGSRVPVIAKIEKPQAVDNLDEILERCEGVMVARGDLGVEVSIEKVPVYQKHIIQRAFQMGKLCITATQMLDSMERNPRPTRAETTDVANAILDGTDAVMLSGETAMGQWPVEAVRTMDRIAREVEASAFMRPTRPSRLPGMKGPHGAILRAAAFANSETPRPIVVFTWSGRAALELSKSRPRTPIFALTMEQRIVDRLSLAWGVTPILVPSVRSTDELIRVGERALLERGHLEIGQEIVLVAGRSPMYGATNMLKIYAIGSEE